MRAARRFLVALAAILPLATLVAINPSQATTADLAPWWQYIAGTYSTAGLYPTPASYFIGPNFVSCGRVPACSPTDSAAWKAAQGAAATTWNQLGSQFKFADAGAYKEVHYGSDQACSTDPTKMDPSELHGGPMAKAGDIGETFTCIIGGRVQGFQMVISYNTNFFTSPTGTPSSGQYDLQSVLTHEFGHALGWQRDHYQACTSGSYNGSVCATGLAASEPADICAQGTSDRGTMCATIYDATTEGRDLAADDKAVFFGAYPKVTAGTGVDPCSNPLTKADLATGPVQPFVIC